MSDPTILGGVIGTSLGVGFGIAKAMSRWLPNRSNNGHHRAPCADLIALDKALAVRTQATEDMGKALGAQMAAGFAAVNQRLEDLNK